LEEEKTKKNIRPPNPEEEIIGVVGLKKKGRALRRKKPHFPFLGMGTKSKKGEKEKGAERRLDLQKRKKLAQKGKENKDKKEPVRKTDENRWKSLLHAQTPGYSLGKKKKRELVTRKKTFKNKQKEA